MAKKTKEDPQNWKGTGKPRGEVRDEWEAMDRSTRPGWVAFVKQKREAHDRGLKKKEFDQVLEGFVGLRITIPNDAEEAWAKLSSEKGFEPLKVMDAKMTGHKAVFYRVTPDQKKELRGVWTEWRSSYSPASKG